jgi:hypothetical protein
MPSETLRLLEKDLLRLPKDLTDIELADFLRDLYKEFQRETAELDDAIGKEVRAKKSAVSTLCECILEAVATGRKSGIDAAVGLISSGLEAVRSDLLAVASRNGDTILRGQCLYRVRESKKGPSSIPANRAFPLAFREKEVCFCLPV